MKICYTNFKAILLTTYCWTNCSYLFLSSLYFFSASTSLALILCTSLAFLSMSDCWSLMCLNYKNKTFCTFIYIFTEATLKCDSFHQFGFLQCNLVSFEMSAKVSMVWKYMISTVNIAWTYVSEALVSYLSKTWLLQNRLSIFKQYLNCIDKLI